ncbi:hypothetical protein [Flavobacterium sp. CAN_S2]|uniref:hypothetical protein n=1 Tax=Flavobacterium sp. CAN_S2 TaxID=2787726 RepID=UPI0018C8F937
MKLVFTICSNNYLAQAKILGDSFLEHHPGWKFIIGLCDEFSDEIDYSFFGSIQIIPVSAIGIYCFDEIIKKYDIIELNTSIKPSFFKYLISKYNDLKTIMYFDPDIQVFSKLSLLEEYLKRDDILITPHILNPIGVDDLSPSENLFLNFGIYNLGFLAVNPTSQNVLSFLDWWEEKTLKIGYNRVSEGLFVDQLWINLVPIFFKKVKILSEYGFNAAPWNLHERNLVNKRDGEYLMSDTSKLVFYHFSSYNYKIPELFSKSYNRYNSVVLSNEIKEIYRDYHSKLLVNKVEFFSKIKCCYIENKEVKIKKKSNLLRSILYNALPPLLSRGISEFWSIIRNVK